LGLAGLFSDRFLLPVIAFLLLQEVWAIAAAVAVAARTGGAASSH
jgi:hypothetical protein